MNNLYDFMIVFDKLHPYNNAIKDHSYNVAISHRAKWYLGELINFLPRRIPFPTKDWGVGGLGIEAVIVVKR